MKKSERAETLTAGQAQYVMSRLIQDRVVTSSQVARYLSEMSREIQELETRLARLKEAQGAARASRFGTPPRAIPAPRPVRTARAARKKPLSRQVQASQRLQGLYLSLMKQTPAEKRPAFRKIAVEQGREEAVKRLRAALRK